MGARVVETVGTWSRGSTEERLGLLASGMTGFAAQYTSQIAAWEQELAILDQLCEELLAREPASAAWTIALEYEIPRRDRRPDVILLAWNVAFVIEFKIGATRFDRSDRWQAEEYAFDLRDFHAESKCWHIAPVLVASAVDRAYSGSRGRYEVFPLHCIGPAHLADLVFDIVGVCRGGVGGGEAQAWLEAPYRPTPTILEAAEQLYASHSVREISHSYADNLSTTCDAIVSTIRDAQQSKRRLVCFVTGVPGSGKTLAGLSAVHDARLREEGRPSSVFLSGNLPLVKVLREALARNRGAPLAESRREVRTFVQNVHSFIREYAVERPSERPHENVIVFDEAQRAWNATKMAKEQGVAASEAQLVLEIMGRCPEWCVVIALIGTGQEIHDGEAGVGEWITAVESSEARWEIVAANDAAELSALERIVVRPSLHLEVSVRSPRAQHIADWVDNVAIGRAAEAACVLQHAGEFPVVLTRDLDVARAWLRDRSRGDRRCGLVASSSSLRHRAYGLELSSSFRRGYRYADWFLGRVDDVRSSFQLEVAASEFECQGLELDWVGLCWGGDLVRSEGAWHFRRFVGRRWQNIRKKERRRYLLNTYRVLLTRARLGMVIWVPPGSTLDPTLDPVALDATAGYLMDAGVAPV